MPDSREFAGALLRWFDRHGRKDLPWQHDPSPYRVWVSEIMLQQTQVATVIPYYLRFMDAFPSVQALAAAPLDQVLGLWSGLGYYARARNLHKAARHIVERHAGEFPHTMAAVAELPGIGRSTAGAVLALSRGERHPILDGNVKRVLSRYLAIAGWPGQSAVQKELWAWAERFTPRRRVDHYTQAIMDLGATVCTRTKPRCQACPIAGECRGLAEGEPQRYPQPRPHRPLPQRRTTMLVVFDEHGAVLLERRPPSGIWGGLWSLPELPEGEAVEPWSLQQGWQVQVLGEAETLLHTFSHFQLNITPLKLRLRGHTTGRVMEPERRVWYKPDTFNQLGLPAPVRRILERLTEQSQGSKR